MTCICWSVSSCVNGATKFLWWCWGTTSVDEQKKKKME